MKISPAERLRVRRHNGKTEKEAIELLSSHRSFMISIEQEEKIVFKESPETHEMLEKMKELKARTSSKEIPIFKEVSFRGKAFEVTVFHEYDKLYTLSSEDEGLGLRSAFDNIMLWLKKEKDSVIIPLKKERQEKEYDKYKKRSLFGRGDKGYTL